MSCGFHKSVSFSIIICQQIYSTPQKIIERMTCHGKLASLINTINILLSKYLSFIDSQPASRLASKRIANACFYLSISQARCRIMYCTSSILPSIKTQGQFQATTPPPPLSTINSSVRSPPQPQFACRQRIRHMTARNMEMIECHSKEKEEECYVPMCINL